MRLAGIPQFVHMTPDPLYQAVSVPVAPLMSREPSDEETRRHRNSSDVARFDFDLGEPRFVLGIRIRCVYGVDARRLASFQLIWRQSRGPDVSSLTIHGARTETVAVDVNPNDMWARRYGRVGKKTVTIWINDEVARFSVVPDREAVEFRISEIDLLVPAAVPQRLNPDSGVCTMPLPGQIPMVVTARRRAYICAAACAASTAHAQSCMNAARSGLGIERSM